jgi:integrase
MEYVEGFERVRGWKALEDLLLELKSDRDRAFFLFMFKCGARVGEALALTAENFIPRPVDNVILVRGMKMEKRWIKHKDTGKTETLSNAVRKTFPILITEQFSDDIIEFTRGKHGLLFPSPYKDHTRPLTQNWAYKLIRKTSENLMPGLRHDLGLDRPLLDKQGNKVKEQIELWNHYFRSLRASQLKVDYAYSMSQLLEWFSWRDLATATHYAHSGWTGLADQMKNPKAET